MDSYLTDTQMSILHTVTGEQYEKREVGTLTKMADFVLSASGFKLQNTVSKIINDKMHAHLLGMELKGQAPKSKFVERLRSYGIKDHDIEIFKILAEQDDALYVQSIREMDIETARGILERSGIDPLLGEMSTKGVGKTKWTDKQVKNHLFNLAYKYSAANYDLSRLASPTPNDYVAYKLGSKGAIDDIGGLAHSLALQLKTFTVGLGRTYRLLNNEKLVANRLKNMSYMVGLLTVLGGLKIMVQDVLNGESVTDPTAFDEDAPILNNFLVRALATSGALPFMADMALRDYHASGGDFTADLVGPSAKLLKNTFEAAGAVASSFGEDEVKIKSIGKPLSKWIPGMNIWYSKAIVNKYFLDTIKEGLDPEWREDLEKNREKSRERNSGNLWDQENLLN